jgi:hypothetical protein
MPSMHGRPYGLLHHHSTSLAALCAPPTAAHHPLQHSAHLHKHCEVPCGDGAIAPARSHIVQQLTKGPVDDGGVQHHEQLLADS